MSAEPAHLPTSQSNGQASVREGYFEGLYYASYGSGRPLIALHGFGATSYSWRYLIPVLTKEHSIHLFDLKGHGRSAKPRDGRYSLQDQADLICEFIERHDLTGLTLIGHSMGGGIALLVSLKLLEAGRQRLGSLILIDSIAFPQKKPWFIRFLTMPVIAKLVLMLLPPTFAVKTVLWKAYFDKQKIDRDAIVEYAANLRDPGGIDAIIEVARQVVPENLDNIISMYPRITVPTLILWGDKDQIVSLENGKELERVIEHSQLDTVSRCGHIPHEEDPVAAIAYISRFLTKIE